MPLGVWRWKPLTAMRDSPIRSEVMPESYPVIQVAPEWVRDDEDMGTKEKFWYRKPGDGEKEWLFKHRRPDTGEHWAEKIAAEVAGVLGIPHATVQFAEFQGRRGSVSESFVSDEHDLFHGNQLLERTTEGYDPAAKRALADHSFENIWESFERLFVTRSAVELNKRALAELLILDAVIGNTDRHHENWGMLRWRIGDKEGGSLGPSFDHASSLGRELRDTKRVLLLEENRVGDYSEKAPGQIFWSRQAERAPSPLALVRKAVTGHGSYFGSALQRVAELCDERVTEIVSGVPSEWMSAPAREFVIRMIAYNRNQLLELGR